MLKKTTLFVAILTALIVATPTHALTWDTGYHLFDSGSENEVYMINAATADITGGYIGILALYDTCSATLDGGSIDNLSPFGTSIIDIYSGSVYSLHANDSSQVNVYGCDITSLNTDENSGTISLYTTDYQWDPTGGPGGSGLLTGYWLLSGDSFSIELLFPEDYQYLNFIPEPRVISFALIGTLILIRPRRN